MKRRQKFTSKQWVWLPQPIPASVGPGERINCEVIGRAPGKVKIRAVTSSCWPLSRAACVPVGETAVLRTSEVREHQPAAVPE